MKLQEKDGTKSFDIAPDDEVTFKSLVSKEEIEREIKKNTPGAYIPLDRGDPKAQLEDFLGSKDQEGNKSDLVSRVKKARQAAMQKQIENEMTPDEKKTEAE